MAATARLELRIAPEHKELIERAAALTDRSVTTFATEVLVSRARDVVEGPHRPKKAHTRPVGGWSFPLPDGWDAPLDDFRDYR